MPEHVLLRLGWGPTPQQRLLDAARRLAADVHTREAAELARLIGDSGDTRPAEVEFTQPPLLYWRTDGGALRGSLSQIRGYYQQLRRGRLVMQGPAGAGKTVLAIALTRDLTATFLHIDGTDTGTDTGGAGRARGRVAVRISAPTFDPGGGAPLDQQSTEQVAARLQDWLSGHLQTVYGLREREAAGLVAGGWILPVIDGVDEMDPAEQPPQRAAALLAALNHPTRVATAGGLAPVVLTCRADRYTQLAAPPPHHAPPAASRSAGDGVREVLQDATLVQVEPLTPAAVRAHLLFRFPDPTGTGDGQPRWRPILTRLTTPADPPAATQPGSATAGDDDRGEDLVVEALRSPLRLFLAVDGYRDPTSDPGELTRFRDSASLDAHLFGLLIPAATRLHPRLDSGFYAPEQVHRWLATLARHLADQDHAGRSGTDLLLDELWRAAGPRLPRYLTAAILPLTVAALWLGITWATGDLEVFRSTVAFAAVGVGWAAWRASRAETDLRRIDLRLLRGRGLLRGRPRLVMYRVALYPVVGLAFGGLYGLLHRGLPGPEDGNWIVLVFGDGNWIVLVFGVVVGLVFGLLTVLVEGQRPQAIDSSRQLVTQGLVHNAASFMVYALCIGVVFGVVGGLLPPPAPFGFGLGFVALLMFGLVAVLAPSPWPRYLVTCILLGRRELPWRPARFLDWAYRAGTMRLAGLAVQFRHREFQAWLTAENPTAGSPSR